MSSGKTARYTVARDIEARARAAIAAKAAAEAAAERQRQAQARARWFEEHERRVLAEARAHWKDVSAACETLQRDVQEASTLYGSSIIVAVPTPQVPATGGGNALQAAAKDMESRARKARSDLNDQVAAARSASVLPPASHFDATNRSSHATPSDQVTVRAQVEEALRLLSADVGAEGRANVEDLARTIVADTDEIRAGLTVKALRFEVGAANRAAATARTRQQEVIALRGRLLGLEGPAVEELLAVLDQLRTGTLPIPDDLRGRVERVAADVVADMDGRYALQVLVECLQELGYDVDAGFSTKAAPDDPEYIRRAAWASHAVQISLDPADGSVDFEVVRTEGGGASPDDADLQVQEQFCADYATLRDRVQAFGVDFDTTGITPVGAPVEAAGRPTRRKRRAAPIAKQRSV